MTDEEIAREAALQGRGQSESRLEVIILDAIKRAKSEDSERLDWLDENGTCSFYNRYWHTDGDETNGASFVDDLRVALDAARKQQSTGVGGTCFQSRP